MAKLRYLLLLLITSCGAFKAPNFIHSESIEFDSHIDTYLESKLEYLGTNQSYRHILIRFASLEYPTLGRCIRPHDDSLRTIEIDSASWAAMSHARREALIMHELGHCDLDKGHTYTAPNVMTPNLIGGVYYFNNRSSLLYKFFNNL